MKTYRKRIAVIGLLFSLVLAVTSLAPVSSLASETTAQIQPTKGKEDEDGVFYQSSSTLSTETDAKLSTLMTQLQESLPTDNGSWSVYISDLAGGYENQLNSHPMQAASLIKLYIMGAVYEDYEAVCAAYGKENVDSNLRLMITISDNTAANTLVGYLGNGDATAGRGVVNDFCFDYEFDDTTMGRLLLAGKETGDNITSATDCGHFLRRVYEGKWSHAEDMMNLLAAQERRNKIPALMPEGVKVANKTGELADVENDAGIVYDSANDVVIVFMSENLSMSGNAQTSIAALSRQIYTYYNS